MHSSSLRRVHLDKVALRKFILYEMKRRGFTASNLSRHSGISPTTIHRLLSPEDPRYESRLIARTVLSKLSKTLNTTTEKLETLTRSDDATSSVLLEDFLDTLRNPFQPKIPAWLRPSSPYFPDLLVWIGFFYGKGDQTFDEPEKTFLHLTATLPSSKEHFWQSKYVFGMFLFRNGEISSAENFLTDAAKHIDDPLTRDAIESLASRGAGCM